MAAGLVGLLDDVAALARLAASSIDDIGAAAGRASVKAAGVVIDDAAVTPQYVHGLAAERELPIIGKIAKGSLRNKLFFILPAALLLSAISPALIEIILMAGGTYLCYEGAHKVIHYFKGDDHDHDLPVAMQGPEAEAATISSAIRTDFVLSAEIMVIALKEVLDQGFASRAIILVVVAIIITVTVYGAVALIVKMDDVGLSLAQRDSATAKKFGRLLVSSMPRVLTGLTVIGTVAMLWVGGHILIAGTSELGWGVLYNALHGLEEKIHALGAGAVAVWTATTACSAAFGLVVGAIVVTIVEFFMPAKEASASGGEGGQ